MAIRTDRWLANPRHEHDACGVGFVVGYVKGQKSHRIIEQGLEVMRNLLPW